MVYGNIEFDIKGFLGEKGNISVFSNVSGKNEISGYCHLGLI